MQQKDGVRVLLNLQCSTMLFISVILSGTSRREERGKVEGPRCSVLRHVASRRSHEDVSVELPDAAWLQPASSGSFDFPSVPVRFAQGPSEFAQDDRVKKFACG